MAQEKPSAAAGTAPAADRPDAIRNVALVGHTGAGKTTLVEALLVASGTINRAGRVEDGTTVSDFDEAEARQQRSVSLALAPLAFDGVKINLLDTPGYADFVGDLRAGLRAADAALFVVSAVDGIDGTTRLLWDECAAVGMPRAIVVTKLDQPRADFDETLAVCQRVVRRRRAADVPAPGQGRRHGRRGDRAAVDPGLRLLGRPARDPRGGRRAPGAHPGGARRPHRGDHRRVRGRDPDGPLPVRRGPRPRHPRRRTSRRRWPGAPSTRSWPPRRTAGVGVLEVLELLDPRLPVAAGAPAARR